VQDKRLQIEKIKRGQEHYADHDDEEAPHPDETRSYEDGKAEDGEVSYRSESSGRDSVDRGIGASEHSRTTDPRAADGIVSR
jgi:hypothetical protein